PEIHEILPHSVEAEQGVLSSMLQSKDGREAIAEAIVKIDERYFYVPAHRTIFQVIVDLHDAGNATDFITVTQALRDRNLLGEVGVAAVVTDLATFVPTAANVSYYLEIVQEKYLRREAIVVYTEAVKRLQEEQDDGLSALDVAESKLASLPRRDTAAPGVPIIALAEMTSENFEKDNLLGNRFLCRKGGMLFIGPTGIGKSTAGLQMDICWSCGREAFGIKPVRPLGILYIQAENDEGDLSEMAAGIIKQLNLSEHER